ncbi:MAG TPA: hypothetical protein VI357_08795 [Mycobacteriales bacterium]
MTVAVNLVDRGAGDRDERRSGDDPENDVVGQYGLSSRWAAVG